MGARGTKTGDEQPLAGPPEDVAVLYSWAKLQGAKYRDFSASRREYRAQVRYRAAQTLRERELHAQAHAEASAAAAERAALAALVAEDAARLENTGDSQKLRIESLWSAEAAARKALAERVEAGRRAEAASHAAAAAAREQHEIAEAHASANRQASSYAESEVRRRQRRDPQPAAQPRSSMGDPNMASSAELDECSGDCSRSSQRLQQSGLRGVAGETGGSEEATQTSSSTLIRLREAAQLRRPRGYRPDDTPGGWHIDRLSSDSNSNSESQLLSEPHSVSQSAIFDAPARRSAPHASGARTGSEPEFNSTSTSDSEFKLDPEPGLVGTSGVPRCVISQELEPSSLEEERTGPAWLYASETPPRTRVLRAVPPSYAGDTLQDSRERVAARWFGLNGIFEHAGPELPAMQPVRRIDGRAPLVAVFSLAGGVGKTSLAATLGRALSVQGERVLLTDTTSYGLLPFYFGARELRPGVVRAFSPPGGGTGAPISLLSYDFADNTEDERRRERLTGDILQSGDGHHRVVLDVSSGANWLIRRIANLHPTVLVPIGGDMNSIIGLQAVERMFQSMADSDGRSVLPFYVLNQFDASLPLHLDVREVFRRQLGDRLLQVAIRRSPVVSEALAEGTTVVDYAPDAPVTQDYLEVASWLRSVSPPAAAGLRTEPWTERWTKRWTES